MAPRSFHITRIGKITVQDSTRMESYFELAQSSVIDQTSHKKFRPRLPIGGPLVSKLQRRPHCSLIQATERILPRWKANQARLWLGRVTGDVPASPMPSSTVPLSYSPAPAPFSPPPPPFPPPRSPRPQSCPLRFAAFFFPPSDSLEQATHTAVIPAVSSRTYRDQHVGGFQVAVDATEVQRSVALVILHVQFRLIIQQLADNLRVTTCEMFRVTVQNQPKSWNFVRSVNPPFRQKTMKRVFVVQPVGGSRKLCRCELKFPFFIG